WPTSPTTTSTTTPSIHRRSGPCRASLSFPTRRSSDLPRAGYAAALGPLLPAAGVLRGRKRDDPHDRPGRCRSPLALPGRSWGSRSEEHTSELQSRFDLVCRLLLEKKTKQA